MPHTVAASIMPAITCGVPLCSQVVSMPTAAPISAKHSALSFAFDAADPATAAERQIRRLTQALPQRPVCLPNVSAGRITLAKLEPLADALAAPSGRGSRRVS